MPSTVQVLCWKGIPTQVKAVDETGAEFSVPLDERFQQAVDSWAMKTGLAGTDEYLEHWSWGEPEERTGTAEEAATAVASELDVAWPRTVPEMVKRAADSQSP